MLQLWIKSPGEGQKPQCDPAIVNNCPMLRLNFQREVETSSALRGCRQQLWHHIPQGHDFRSLPHTIFASDWSHIIARVQRKHMRVCIAAESANKFV